MDSVHGYVGSELGLFAQAVNWKQYLQRQLASFIQGRVLEVGAGIGGTMRFLRTHHCSHWTCLEPDPDLAKQIVPQMRGASPARDDALTVVIGTIADLAEASGYDAVLYIDVLEHIENDSLELRQAARLLNDGGHLIVVSPAHQWLYSPFDEAIGHYRRYSRRTLQEVTPQGLALSRLRYLDSVGLLASAGNRFLLKSHRPTIRQISVWDNLMVPLSRFLDAALGYRVGKSVCAVWQRRARRARTSTKVAERMHGRRLYRQESVRRFSNGARRVNWLNSACPRAFAETEFCPTPRRFASTLYRSVVIVRHKKQVQRLRLDICIFRKATS